MDNYNPKPNWFRLDPLIILSNTPPPPPAYFEREASGLTN